LLLVWKTLSKIINEEYYRQGLLNFNIKDMTVKEDKLIDLNRSQDSDSSKAYVTGYNWKTWFISANCKLAASFGVELYRFYFFLTFFLEFTEVYSIKNIFFFFSFSF
jgi:hypothetical protein